MKKNVLHRIIVSCMSALMLVASVGFSVDFHYCNGHFKGINVIGSTSSCSDSKSTCSSFKGDSSQNEDKPCCSNHTIDVDELEQEFVLRSAEELVDDDTQISTFHHSKVIVDHFDETQLAPFPDKAFSYQSRDIYALNESYIL